MSYRWDSQAFIRGARNEGASESTISACLAAADAIRQKHRDLPIIFTLNHLAHLADVNAEFLQSVAHRQVDAYRVFRVKKRGTPDAVPRPERRYRTICVPHPQLMRVQRWIAQNVLQVTPLHHASFAFSKGRDLVASATKHAGAKWLVKMDVRHFFESVFEDAVYWVFRSMGYGALLSFQMARICTRLPDHSRGDPRSLLGRGGGYPYRRHSKGHLPQGAPTSPMLANRAVEALDHRLESLATSSGWTYTRYADDLAFSRTTTSSRAEAVRLIKKAERALIMSGLESHRQKATVVPPGSRKVLLGLLVDRDSPNLTKAFRNNIETHLYALNHPEIGPERHRQKRGFNSIIGMRRHVMGLIAFAHQVDERYASELYTQVNRVNWAE
jgi:RNA-directed DNA polymerase